jgi:hypothetical protein
LVWSLGLVVAALVLPTYDGQTTTSSQSVTLTTATLVQVNGIRALVVVAIPVLVVALVGVALYRRWVAGARWSAIVAWSMIAILAAEAGLGILSVGAFMVPALILLVMATRLVVTPEAIRPRPTARPGSCAA